MSAADRLNLALRVLIESVGVAGLAYRGIHTGESTGVKNAGDRRTRDRIRLLGGIDFHQAGRLAEPTRLVQELVISGLAATAWYAAGQSPVASVEVV